MRRNYLRSWTIMLCHQIIKFHVSKRFWSLPAFFLLSYMLAHSHFVSFVNSSCTVLENAAFHFPTKATNQEIFVFILKLLLASQQSYQEKIVSFFFRIYTFVLIFHSLFVLHDAHWFLIPALLFFFLWINSCVHRHILKRLKNYETCFSTCIDTEKKTFIKDGLGTFDSGILY